jgi:hypothetical protein
MPQHVSMSACLHVARPHGSCIDEMSARGMSQISSFGVLLCCADLEEMLLLQRCVFGFIRQPTVPVFDWYNPMGVCFDMYMYTRRIWFTAVSPGGFSLNVEHGRNISCWCVSKGP